MIKTAAILGLGFFTRFTFLLLAQAQTEILRVLKILK